MNSFEGKEFMKKGKFLIALIFVMTYAVTIWYLLKINFFFIMVSYGDYAYILSENKRSIFLLGVGLFHVFAMLLFTISNGKNGKLFVFSGALGCIYVLIYFAYRLVDSVLIGGLTYSYRSVLGHLGLLILAVITILVSRIKFYESNLDNF